VSKHLHALAFSRQVWLGLLSSLYVRNFIDLFPEERLSEFSLDALINLAKTTVLGPSSWTPYTRGRDVHVARSISLHPKLQSIMPWQYLAFYHETRLLPGGRFVLFKDQERLYCWNVADDRLFWKYQPIPLDPRVCDFDPDVIDEGRAVIIVVGVYLHATSNYYVDVIHLDLLCGTSYSFFPGSSFSFESGSGVHISSVKVCDNFATILVQRMPEYDVYLVKLSTRPSCRKIIMPVESQDNLRDYRIALISGHMITVEYNASHESYLRVWNIHSLMLYPSPVITRDTAPVSLLHSQTIFLPSQTISPQPFPRFPYLSLSVHESPLREGLYTIWVAVSGGSTVEATYKYDLSLLGSTSLSLHWKTSQPYQLPRSRSLQDNTRISYAGHAVLATSTLFSSEILSLSGLKPHSRTKTPRIRRMGTRYFWQKGISESKRDPWNHVISLPNLQDRDLCVHLSTYSRALTFREEDTIVINYYD
ncbi:hypothetical protein L208DRAFT_1388657, partial [Tricholoma matsutake]